jgi:hypothetical protein
VDQPSPCARARRAAAAWAAASRAACNLAIRASISSAAACRARLAFLGAAFGGVPAFSFPVDPADRTAFFGGGVRLAANVFVAGGILFGMTFRTTGPPVRVAVGFSTGDTVGNSSAIASLAGGSFSACRFATRFATPGPATGGFGDAGFTTASFVTGGSATGDAATEGLVDDGDGESVINSLALGDATVGDVTLTPDDCFVAIGGNSIGSSSTAGIGLCRSAGSGVVIAID